VQSLFVVSNAEDQH